MELAAGARLGPYEVLEPLGAGGMGQVWRARDTRLGREVAIKIIAHEKAGDAGLQSRFEREARALSALNHPNIVSVYDVGEHDGAQYIVSELVHGESLRQLISRGPLPSDRLVRIAAQISNALAAAHRAGIVHRDLKPENIMITSEGSAKILDFGLARHIKPQAAGADSTVTQTAATQAGMVMGTAGYMSPEQICGEEVDGRSDIFSVGVVLFEMASGARAFPGRTHIEMMSAVLKDDPPQLPAKSFGALDRIIRRCLEKIPAKRFQSAAELNSALEALNAGAASHPGIRSRWIGWTAAAAVAVLTVGVYLAAGRKASPGPATTSTVARAPQAAAPAMPAVTLPATPSAQIAVAAPKVPAPREGKAEHTVDSSSQRAPAKTKTPLGTANAAAYQQAYEEGMLLLSQRKWAEAQGRLTEAIRLNPDSGLAYLGRSHAAMAQQDYQRAIGDCTEVIQRRPDSADAYHERGTAYLLTQQFDRAVEDMNAAIRLGDTDLAIAYNLRGRAHSGLKEWGDAIQDFDEAIRLNPHAPHFFVFRGIALNARSQFRKAIEDFNEALRQQPNLPLAYAQRAIAKQRIGDIAGAAADRNQAKGLRK